MSQNQPDNLGSFISENKAVLKEYLETRMEIYRLQSLRVFSKVAGYFAWVLISLFLAFLILIFGGLMLGYWFSSMLGSYVKGFGLITLLLVVVFVLLALFRKSLFVDPVVHSIIKRSREEEEDNTED
jgi:sterol desaturase/sphingolipid hydroxylase (fatty acid hydroxylase superfamily)